MLATTTFIFQRYSSVNHNNPNIAIHMLMEIALHMNNKKGGRSMCKYWNFTLKMLVYIPQ